MLINDSRNYCAHVLISVRYKDSRPSDTIFVYENVILIQCKSEEEDPWLLAEQVARKKYLQEGENVQNFLEGRPSYHQYEGIRKIVSVDEVVQGGELTYMQLELADEVALKALVARKAVSVLCYDDELPADEVDNINAS